MGDPVSLVDGHIDGYGPFKDRHKTCKWAKFDELWGEYKCKLFYIRLGQHKKCEHCRNYAKRQEIK